MWHYELPNLKSIVQVFHSSGKTKFLKTYSLDLVGLEGNLDQFFLEVQTFTNEKWEMSFGIHKGSHSSSSTFKSYVDDSMKLINRPIYDKNFKIQHTNEHELFGYFTSPCVHGGMLSEKFRNGPKDEEHQLSWSNSNPIGCTLSANNQIDFMVFRNIQSNDNKGVREYFTDPHATSTSFIFRL